MVHSVAVLSDVHGALPALEAVLAEPDVRAAERIVLTGDIAAGPLPVETLDLLTSRGERIVWVRGNDEVVLVDSSLARWADVLSTVPGDVRTVVCGHTHMPFQRLVDRRLVVNPGSVGMPYGRPGPHWALLRDGVVTLRATAVDPDALADAVVAASSYPGAAVWADQYARTVYSDADALTVFAPRDGRPVVD